MNCKKCGKEIDVESNYCMYCGNKIEETLSRKTERKNSSISNTQSFVVMFFRWFFGVPMMFGFFMLLSEGFAFITALAYGTMGFMVTPMLQEKIPTKKRWIIGIICFFTLGITSSFRTTEKKEVKLTESQKVEISRLQQEASRSDMETQKVVLSISDIISNNNHPKIGDLFEEAKIFSKEMNDPRIKAVSVVEKVRIEEELKKEFDDKNILYLEQDPLSGKYLGAIEIKIYDNVLAKKFDLNKVVDLLKTYLPDNFSEYYKKDRAYIVEHEHFYKYVYSVRLNDKGRVFRRDNNKEYSYYMAFYILHYKNNGYWKIYTDYSAYGGPELGWIDKYATPWNINLNS